MTAAAPSSRRRAGRLARLLVFLVLLLSGHGAAVAAVEIAFYSREMGGSHFPHAFVRLSGTPDAGGEPVDTTFGFTARRISPAILFGSVAGHVVVEVPQLVARSRREFALILTDAQYEAVQETVRRWRGRRQPSYNLNRRNCVHFVADLARTIGLRVENAEALMKRPGAFLAHVRSLNAGLINLR